MTEGLPKNMGENAERLLSATLAAGVLVVATDRDMRASRNLNGRGLLRRNPQDGCIWYPTDMAYSLSGVDRPAGMELVDHHGAAVAVHAANHAPASDIVPIGMDGGGMVDVLTPACVGFTVPATRAAPDAESSELVDSIKTARALLNAGDVRAALLLSTGAYEQAKAALNYAEKVKASRELIEKARRMQAEALKIESMCYVAMANTIDEAQQKGKVAKQGRVKVRDADVFTLDDVGIDKRRLHEARKLRDAVREQPDFVDRVIAARLEAGLDPSRRSLSHAIGTRSASAEDKGDQLYQTPIEAMRTLLALESFSATVKEPAVGKGAIMRPLEDAGYEVMIADLVDRGVATRHGELQQVGDFLLSVAGPSAGVDIVTNPPYAELANSFPAHALREHKPRKMALLLNWNFAAGFDDPNRVFVMDENPPSRVYLFTRRLPMMHRDGWDGPEASSQMNTAWFVWERNEDGTYGDGFPRIIRVDWKAYENATPLAPGAGGNVAPMTFKPQPDEFARETPRRTMDERLGEERARALVWMLDRDEFDDVTLRRGIGVRPSVSEALIASLSADGLIEPRDGGNWALSDAGTLALQATAGVLLLEAVAQ
ncbi:CcrM-like DNA methyltransferase [Sinorhizobium phage phi2LM21]|nr:CcrM-like DNA methyltransferase [Sinorhizobium phage phi2LM21]